MVFKKRIGKVSVIHKGEKCDVEWELDLNSLSEKNGEGYGSPDFNFEGGSWYMFIYPNGRTRGALGYFDVGLQKAPYTYTMNVQLSFSFKTLNGRKEFQRQATHVFTSFSFFDSSHFLSRSDFERRRSEFLSPSGMLTVVCTLQRLDSAGSMNDISKPVCSYCEKTFDADEISLHEKKCRVKCPDCSDVVLYEKWRDHECQTSGIEGKALLTEPSKILEDFKELFLKQKECDVVITVKGQEFSAHRAILIARSPVFESTFRNDMKEKATGAINIEDCDPSSFSEFLHFLYCADADTIPEGKVFSLFVTADKYDVSDLKLKCIEFMKENLSIDTICETITLALQYSETELLNLATDFFIKESEKIIKTVKWQTFLVENPIQANELFIKALSDAKNSKV